jgi:hypothetical protein
MLSEPVDAVLAALELAQKGRFDEIRGLFAPDLQPLVAPQALEAAWTTELDRQGPVASVGAPVTEPTIAGTTIVKCRSPVSAAASR